MAIYGERLAADRDNAGWQHPLSVPDNRYLKRPALTAGCGGGIRAHSQGAASGVGANRADHHRRPHGNRETFPRARVGMNERAKQTAGRPPLAQAMLNPSELECRTRVLGEGFLPPFPDAAKTPYLTTA